MIRAALAVALVLLASPVLADGKPPAWHFIAKTQTDTGPVMETRSKAYPTAGRCEDAKSEWLRKQSSITIVELLDCQPVAVVPARGK